MASSSADEQPSKRTTCGICKLEFPGDLALYEHVELVHVKTWVQGQACGWDGCASGSGSKDANGFRVHLRTHSGERPFQCQHGCDKSFAQKAQMDAHSRTHTGERPYKCRHSPCTKAFKQIGARRAHEFIHTGEHRYVCTSCNTRYIHISSRNKCKLRHETPLCAHCGMRPQTRGTLCGYCDNSKHTRS